jgi:hypothetical protein
MQDHRLRKREEQTKQEVSRVKQESVSIEARVTGETDKLLSQPEFANMAPEEFMKTPEYKAAIDSFDEVRNPTLAEDLKRAYASDLLSRHGNAQAKAVQEHTDRTAGMAQLGAATRGTDAQLSMFDTSLEAGAERGGVLKNLMLAGASVGTTRLTELMEQGDWTPEEKQLFASTINTLKERYNQEANLAYAQAGKVQDRTARLHAYEALYRQYGEDLSDDKKTRVLSEAQTLIEEIASEEWIGKNFGNYSTTELSLNMPEGMRTLPLADIKRQKDKAALAALKAGDVKTVLSLASIPTDVPDAIKEYMNGAFLSLGSADAEGDPALLTAAMGHANAIKDTLGAVRLKETMSAEAYAAYVDIAGISQFKELPEAIAEHQKVQQLLNNGDLPVPKGWTKTRESVVTDVLGALAPDGTWYKPNTWFADSPMDRASLQSMLNPFFERWKVQGLSESDMLTRAKKVVADSAWGGYLNGGVLGEQVNQLTQGINGNPYGDRSGHDLLKAYQDGVKASNPDLTGVTLLIGENPNKLFLVDEGGLPIPNSIVSPKIITDWIKGNVPTTKQEILNERERSTGPARFNGIDSLESVSGP